MKITKKYLRQRWKSDEFLESFPLPLKESIKIWRNKKKLILLKNENINNIDLRGISDDELCYISTFYKTNNSNINFSYGRGAVGFSNGEYSKINFQEFNFDRASCFRKSKISNFNFNKSKLIFDSNDTIFKNCDFSETKFKGGFNEYGFKRCVFINCSFKYSQWKNLYFFACKFKNCDFSEFFISNAKIGGFKIDKITTETDKMFLNCDIDGLVEI